VKLEEYSLEIGAVYQTGNIRGFERPNLISPYIFKTIFIFRYFYAIKPTPSDTKIIYTS